jgi:tetraacyldisaccharide 4'-kinase
MASWIYYPLIKLRASGYALGILSRKRLPVPVISVGNITLGGSGKTPMVEKIAKRLSTEQKRAAILTRGYKGSSEGKTLLVSDGARLLAGANEAGDEAYMLARSLPSVAVVVGKDRFRSGMLAIRDLNAQALILDDGFQHLALRRDLDVVLIDGAEPFGHGHMFPRGLLREPLTGLSRAHIFVIIQGPEHQDLKGIQEVLRRYNRRAPIFSGKRRPLFLVAVPEGTRRELEEIRGKRCMAVSGIANPSSFLSLLLSLGTEVIGSFSFPDHHPYAREELRKIAGEAQGAGAHSILTTEKDAVRIPLDLFPLPVPLLYLRMEIELSDDAGFFSLLKREARLDG